MKKKLIFILGLMVVFALISNFNIRATSDDGNYQKSTETNERGDDNEGDDKTIQPKKSSNLTIPVEGSWDSSKTKDIKNSSGKIVERRYYSSKNVLMEKRFYTYKGTIRIMEEKHLYWSDGKTLEKKREYGYISSSDSYYIIKSYKYRDDETREWTLLYSGKTNDTYEKRYVYSDDGNWYKYVSYYNGKTTNRLTKRLYYDGFAPNYVTHLAEYNSSGNVYDKVTYFDKSYNEGLKTKIIKYSGEDVGNKKLYIWCYDKVTQQLTNTTYYDETGKYIDFDTIWKDGLKKERTYYNKDAKGKKNRTLYYDGDDDSNVLNIKYFSEDGSVTKDYFYKEYPYRSKEISYYADGKKMKEKILYQEYDNLKDVVIQWDENGNEVKKYRYFQDGEHLRWKVNYSNIKKVSLDVYDSTNNYKFSKKYTYTENDDELEARLLEYQVDDAEATYLDVFNNEIFSQYICDKLETNVDSTIYIEDFKSLIAIEINDAKALVDDYAKKLEKELSDSDVLDEDENLADYLSELTFDTINGLEFCTELEKLVIRNGEVTEISDDIKFLNKLSHIDFGKNDITSISENIANISSIQVMNFEENELETTSNLITNLSSLNTLNLVNNPSIKFLSKDIYDKYRNGNLKNISMDKSVKYIDSDFDARNVLYSGELLGSITIEDRFMVKSYSEDKELNFYDFLVPQFSKSVIDDLNDENIDYGSIKVTKLSDEYSYKDEEFKMDMLDGLLLSQSNNNVVYDAKEKFDNDIFDDKGIYYIELNVDYGSVKIKQEIAFVVFDISANDFIEQMEEDIENDESDSPITEISTREIETDESTLDLHDEENVVISQSEQVDLEKESKAMEQYEEVIKSIDFEEVENFAGVYLDKNKDVVIQLAKTKNESQDKISSSDVEEKVSEHDDLKVQYVEYTYDELMKFAEKIAKKLDDKMLFSIKINEEKNGLIISSTKAELENVKNDVAKLSFVNKINVKYSVDEGLGEGAINKASSVRMASTLYVDLENGWVDRASFGYRAKRKITTTVKKDGKNVKKKVWIKGATIPNHMDKPVGTKIYKFVPVKCSKKGNDCVKKEFYVGKINKRSKSTDTDFVRFSSSYAKPIKKLRKSTEYTATTNNSKYLVKGAKVWKIYKSVYTDAKWVSGKIVSTSAYTGLFEDGDSWEDTIHANIASTGGDSGSPLVRYYGKYKSGIYKKYILGTTIGGIDNDRYFAKVNNSKKKLDIVSY